MAVKKATEAAETAERTQAEVSTDEAKRTENGGTAAATGANKAVTYTAEEFAKAAGIVFDKPYNQDIVMAAFKMAGKTESTKAEAAEIVSRFLNKEVKVK